MDTTKSTNSSVRKHRSRVNSSHSTYYHLQNGEVTVRSRHGNKRFRLLQNYADTSNKNVVIEFYLSKPAVTKLILMDNDLTDAIYLINKKLEAGRHIFRSDIRNEELLRFKYYYKLDAYGYNEVRRMHYVQPGKF